MHFKHLALGLLLFGAAVAEAWAVPSFDIVMTPVYYDTGSNGTSGRVEGTPYSIYSEAFNVPTTTLDIINTGPAPDDTPLNSVLPFGYDYYLKTQAGAAAPPSKQMVVQLEGTSIAGQGGMIDIISNGMFNVGPDVQPVPSGKDFWTQMFEVFINDVPFPSEPTVLTNSRLQFAQLVDNHDPATANLTNWFNVEDDDGLLPVINSSWDSSGLDLSFAFDGSFYAFGALEDSGLRVVTFFDGPLPGDGGPGGVPTPATAWLLGLGLLALARGRRRTSTRI